MHEFSQYFTRVLKDYRGRNLKLDEIEWDGIISDVLNISNFLKTLYFLGRLDKMR